MNQSTATEESIMQATDTTYNGWTNYATWGVALVLDNDEATYTHVRNMAELIERASADEERFGQTVKQHAAFKLGEALKDYTEELCGLEDDEDHLSLMARQVIQAGLGEVNWDEIASNILSES